MVNPDFYDNFWLYNFWLYNYNNIDVFVSRGKFINFSVCFIHKLRIHILHKVEGRAEKFRRKKLTKSLSSAKCGKTFKLIHVRN